MPIPAIFGPQKIAGIGADSCDLLWTENKEDDFSFYTLYISDKPNIADKTRMNVSPNRAVREDVEALESISTRSDTGRRVSSLTAGSYFFVIVTEDLNGRVSVSNEIQVNVG